MKYTLDDFLESEFITVFMMLYVLAWVVSGCGIVVIVEAHIQGEWLLIILSYLFSLSGFYIFYKSLKS